MFSNNRKLPSSIQTVLKKLFLRVCLIYKKQLGTETTTKCTRREYVKKFIFQVKETLFFVSILQFELSQICILLKFLSILPITKILRLRPWLLWMRFLTSTSEILIKTKWAFSDNSIVGRYPLCRRPASMNGSLRILFS